MVFATTAALAWWAWVSGSPAMPAVLLGGLAAAAIGFADDHRPVSPAIRLAGHAVVSVMAVVALQAYGGVGSVMGVVTGVAAVVFVAWSINLTNFMDGIDGIAGVQTLTVAGAAAGLSAAVSPETGLWFEPAVLSAASMGYLIWNWPPARVFLGDVGSGFIGYMVAVLTLRAAVAVPELGWCWLILSGVFLVDATLTLAIRAMRRDRLFHAHRSHAYQHLAGVWGHRRVTLLVAAINVCWLLPLAALVAFGYLGGPAGLLLACLPLAGGALWLGAGQASHVRLNRVRLP